METRRKVKTYLIEYICSTCQSKMERVEGNMMLTYPLQYLYKCPEDHEERLTKLYPYTEYVYCGF